MRLWRPLPPSRNHPMWASSLQRPELQTLLPDLSGLATACRAGGGQRRCASALCPLLGGGVFFPLALSGCGVGPPVS